MPEQVLRIEPEHELKFKGPFTTPTTSLLKLSNPSEKRVCFKIKTTAPKRYCVRPNAGVLEPGSQINIAVVFQPCELEPTASKHKFMVQSLFVPDGEVNMDAIWKDVESSKVMDSKLRCTFEMPADAERPATEPNAVQEEKHKSSKHEDVSKSPKSFDEARGIGDTSSRVSHGHDADKLKQENVYLRNELEKAKRQLKSREFSGNMVTGTSSTPPAVPMLYIVLALCAAIIGLLLGKFVL